MKPNHAYIKAAGLKPLFRCYRSADTCYMLPSSAQRNFLSLQTNDENHFNFKTLSRVRRTYFVLKKKDGDRAVQNGPAGRLRLQL